MISKAIKCLASSCAAQQSFGVKATEYLEKELILQSPKLA